MELGFAKTDWSQNALRGSRSHSGCQLDWHGLRARLFAVRTARHVLEAQAFQTNNFTGGSFDHDSALRLATYGDGLCRVNPTALANGNSGGAMDVAVAGANGAGDRG